MKLDELKTVATSMGIKGTAKMRKSDLVEAIKARCTEVDSGARNVDHILSNAVLPELSRLVLEHLSMSTSFGDVHMVLDAQENFAFHFRPASPLEHR